MNTMEVALICKALGDANRLRLFKCFRKGKNAAVCYWRNLKLPSLRFHII